VHRDIKPENFLMQNSDADSPLKVIDFGLSRHYAPGDPLMQTRDGTPYYVAPQVLEGAYDEKCDIWSCGVIAYVLLCGYPPFDGNDDKQVLESVKKGRVEFPEEDWDGVSKEAKSFITDMFIKNPSKRPSAASCLTHSWLGLNSKAQPQTSLAPGLVGRLRKFRAASKLKKMALTFIAQQLKDEDIQELRDTFSALDVNNDGTLTPQEIREGMRLRGLEIPEDLDAVISSLDTDGSKSIEYSEFVAATVTARNYATEEIMWAAFRAIDNDGDGFIGKPDLANMVVDPGSSSFVSMIKDADLDGDERISFEEFKEMMQT
jgi:calcium-dependent protein kinase